MHSSWQLELVFYTYTHDFKRQKYRFLTLSSILHKFLQRFAICFPNRQTPPSLRGQSWRQEARFSTSRNPIYHGVLPEKSCYSRYFKCLNKPNRTSCTTILMELGIKIIIIILSKAARSLLLTDTSQVPEAHSETGCEVTEYMDFTFNMFPMGHETAQKLQLFPEVTSNMVALWACQSMTVIRVYY